MTWQWLDTWLEEYCRADQQLLILTVWHGERLVAAIPLLLSRHRRYGLLSVTQLEIVGTGEPEWEEVCGEYSDLVAEPEHLTEAAALFSTYLQALKWDRFVLRKILDGAQLTSILIPLLSDVTVNKKICGHRYRVTLPDTVDQYRNGLARRMQRRMRRLDKFTESPGISTAIVEDADTVATALAELRELHQSRWQQVGKPGAFSSSRFSRFHDKVAVSFLREGWLKLQQVSDRGKAIAINYNIRFGKTEYYYQSGFNIEGYRNQSLGVMAHMNAIGGAIDDGLDYYDFMHAVGDSYKHQYQCLLTELEDITLTRPTFTGHILQLVDRMRDGLRQLKRSSA